MNSFPMKIFSGKNYLINLNNGAISYKDLSKEFPKTAQEYPDKGRK